MHDLLEKYAQKKRMIEQLTAEADEIKVQIVEEMEASGEKKVENSFGTFSISSRKTWKYSKKVEEAESKVKIMKADEQEAGIAVCTETKSLVYNDINNKKNRDE